METETNTTEEIEVKQPEIVDTTVENKVLTVLEQFYEELKVNPKKYTDVELIEHMFEKVKIVYNEGLQVKLPQSAEKYFNLIGGAFTILVRIFMAKHGMVPVVNPTMNLTPPQEQKPTIIL